MNNYYVYALVNPIDDSIFYIGKGNNNRVLYHYSNVSLRDSLRELINE